MSDRLEKAARAALEAEPRLAICGGAAPCKPEPCSCTRNIYPFIEAALTAADAADGRDELVDAFYELYRAVAIDRLLPFSMPLMQEAKAQLTKYGRLDKDG